MYLFISFLRSAMTFKCEKLGTPYMAPTIFGAYKVRRHITNLPQPVVSDTAELENQRSYE
jgi:hypothetical protein